MPKTTILAGMILLSLCDVSITPAGPGGTQYLFGPQLLQAAQDDQASRLAGTWQKEVSDAYTSATTILTLRSDKTYTKVFRSKVGGAPYGGTHDGTWTANGMVVQLSGDGNWPATRENLREFRKLQ